jgi:hypothetical protein
MSFRMRLNALSYGLLLGALIGCGGDDGGGGNDGPTTGGDDAGDGARRCIDEDDDGFPTGCSTSRRDCDDGDPTITDECRRCIEENEGCPCEPGTEFKRCDPEDLHTVQDGVMGIVVCDEGQRWCRDGVWTECEILWQYATFMPDE